MKKIFNLSIILFLKCYYYMINKSDYYQRDDCFLFNQATCLHGQLQFDIKLKTNCLVLFMTPR